MAPRSFCLPVTDIWSCFTRYISGSDNDTLVSKRHNSQASLPEKSSPESLKLSKGENAATNGVALVIGAGSGIGREAAFTFAEKGARIVIFADIDENAAREASNSSLEMATHHEYGTLAIRVDVASRDSVDQMVARVVSKVGRIDYCVNTAGVGTTVDAKVADMPTKEFDRVYNINGRGTFFCTSAVSRVMLNQDERFIEGRNGRRSIGRGSIVNISSLNGVIPIPYHSQYGSSKYAAVGISLTAAAEMASQGVRLNVVLPSWTNTSMIEKETARNPSVPEMINTASPLNRMAQPEEVAEAVHFLCSPGASYINGAQIVIDAAFSLTRGFA